MQIWEALAAGAAGAAVLGGPLALYARHLRRLVGSARGETDAAQQQVGHAVFHQQFFEREMDDLVARRLPAVLESGEAGPDSAPGAEPTVPGTRLQNVLDQVAAAISHERAQTESARADFLTMAQRVQVMALAQQQDLDELEQGTDDPRLMAGLMRSDHAAAQLARQAQTMAVLCGAWPGRQWSSAISLLDVVRGAQSRILEYQRVQVQGSAELAVEASAAEPLIHAVAELLDNAARYSPPTAAVLVAIRSVHSGAVVEIDDGGLGMTEQVLEEAESWLSGERNADNRGLGGSARLGLASVGLLASRYGFSVKLISPSAYGGVRAVVLVPSELLVEASSTLVTPAPPQVQVPPRAQAPSPQAQMTTTAHAPVSEPLETEFVKPDDSEPATSVAGLPQRRSRRSRHAAPQGAGAPAPAPNGNGGTRTLRTPDEAAALMSSIQTGTRAGREQPGEQSFGNSQEGEQF